MSHIQREKDHRIQLNIYIKPVSHPANKGG